MERRSSRSRGPSAAEGAAPHQERAAARDRRSVQVSRPNPIVDSASVLLGLEVRVAGQAGLVRLQQVRIDLGLELLALGLVRAALALEFGGAGVDPGGLLGQIAAGAGAAAAAPAAAAAATPAPAPKAAPAAAMPPAPAAAKIAADNNLSTDAIAGSGKRGQVLKGDVLAAVAAGPVAAPTPVAPIVARVPSSADDASREERVRMTKLRQTIARRLKDAQNTAAMLTTFNEVDMGEVMALRARYKDVFEKKHGAKLGFMSFFVKACTQALKDVPAVNAEIDGTDLVYKNYYHLGIAVGTEKGLVVPVVRDADRMGLAAIEKAISDFGKRARDGSLKLEEMQGGTFTITNGGIYGSLMSTPILNAPQSGILGMHKIQDRPMVVGGKIEVRPMMYLALSYDHRIVDGKEAVTFLVRVKEALEDPARLVLDL